MKSDKFLLTIKILQIMLSLTLCLNLDYPELTDLPDFKAIQNWDEF
jgi:hypothetical protein